jgi:3-deoxy-D-manno-octulosonate 8-phosphate phosphatase (KDO 8-P phosphatase)
MDDLDARLKRIKFIVSDVDGVLTDGSMGFDGEGRPFRFFQVRDGLGLALWRLGGGKAALVSRLGSPALDAVAKQWKCDECHANVGDKVEVCRGIAERHGITLEEMAFLGDDLVDLPAMETVGLGVAVADATGPVRAAADLVLDTDGGHGALRHLVECLLDAHGRLDETLEKYRDVTTGGQ